jgi:hypothetical protein
MEVSMDKKEIDKCEYCHFCTEEQKASGNTKCILPEPLDEYVDIAPAIRINKNGALEAINIAQK